MNPRTNPRTPPATPGRPPSAVRAPVVLIDGRSGSGKTELAAALVRAWPSAQLVRLDSVYPGWGGLDAGSRAVSDEILLAHRWRRWDWAAGTFADEPAHTLDPSHPLIIEGCGALTAASRRLATLALWVELDAPRRKQRALQRDGKMYVPHWDEWAAQEDAIIEREHPQELADVIIDGLHAARDAARWRRLAEAASMGE